MADSIFSNTDTLIQGPERAQFDGKVNFGRVKGYFGGFVDDVLKGANQQDDVEGAITW